MRGEVIQNIFNPKNDEDWVLIETTQNLFSLRLGGFKKETNISQLENYDNLPFPYKNKKIKEVYTDEEWLYLLLEGGGVIASGWTDSNFSGDMRLGIKFSDIKEYEVGFFESDDMLKLKLGSDDWSTSTSC